MPTLRPQNAEQQHQMRPWIAEENSAFNRQVWKKRPQNAYPRGSRCPHLSRGRPAEAEQVLERGSAPRMPKKLCA
jgi:hypothetical protein